MLACGDLLRWLHRPALYGNDVRRDKLAGCGCHWPFLGLKTEEARGCEGGGELGKEEAGQGCGQEAGEEDGEAWRCQISCGGDETLGGGSVCVERTRFVTLWEIEPQAQ